MGIANIGAKWSSGTLTFINKATGATIFSIALTGITSALLTALTGTVTCSGDVEINPQFVKGSRFTVEYPQIVAADVAKTFFIAPAACKIVSAYERHVTVAGQAGALTLEKLTSGEAPGAGDELIAAGWDLTSAANTPVSKTAVTTAAGTFAAGDALALKKQSGDAASYALGTVTVVMEWL